MALHAALDWLLIAVCVITYGLVLAEAAGVVRQLLALKKTAERMADQPLVAALPKAEAAVARLEAAAQELPLLALRATLAIARIRAAVVAALHFARSLRSH